MANKIYRKDALTIAIENLIADKEYGKTLDDEPIYGEDVIKVLKGMFAQVTKPRTKSDTPSKSKARMSNEALAKQLHELCGDDPFNCTYVQEHLNGVMTPQKAVAVMNVGIDLGLFIEGLDGKKRIYTAVH